MIAGIPVRGPKQSTLSKDSTKLQIAPAEVFATLSGGGTSATVAAVMAGTLRDPLQRGHWMVAPASSNLASRNCWQCAQLNLMDVMRVLPAMRRCGSQTAEFVIAW